MFQSGLKHSLKCKWYSLKHYLKKEFDEPSPHSVSWALGLLTGFLTFLYLPLAGRQITVYSVLVVWAFLYICFTVLRATKIAGDAPFFFYGTALWMVSPLLVNGLGFVLHALGVNYIADNLRFCQMVVFASPFIIAIVGFVVAALLEAYTGEIYDRTLPNYRDDHRS